MTDLEAGIARTFAAFEAAAINGDRAPANNVHPVRSEYAVMLARRGDIRIEIYGYNFRVVEILTGPHKGKRTAPDPLSGKLWKILDADGHRRICPDGSVIDYRGRPRRLWLARERDPAFKVAP